MGKSVTNVRRPAAERTFSTMQEAEAQLRNKTYWSPSGTTIILADRPIQRTCHGVMLVAGLPGAFVSTLAQHFKGDEIPFFPFMALGLNLGLKHARQVFSQRAALTRDL